MFNQDQPAIGQPTKEELSIISDPFFVKHITSINIHGMPMLGQQRWSARVDFNAGLTAGSQETGACKNFEEVIQKLKAILDEVQRK